MTPAISDRRERQGDHRFVPAVPHRENPETDGEIEARAFDKAEEAESIKDLYTEKERIERTLTDSDGDKRPGVKDRETLKRKLGKVKEEIAMRETEREEKEREEG